MSKVEQGQFEPEEPELMYSEAEILTCTDDIFKMFGNPSESQEVTL